MIIHNGDHAQFEIEHANTPPEERPDWPLPSFDAQDWAKAFLKAYEKGSDDFLAEDTMIGWFANALMRGYDEGVSSARDRKPLIPNAETIEALEDGRAGRMETVGDGSIYALMSELNEETANG